MLAKKERLAKILELIAHVEVETQEELAENLRKSGYDVTQATVSRDIRELRLSKKRGSNGKLHYVAPDNDNTNMTERFKRVMKDGLVSMDQAQNILVIKTVSGMAMAVAASLDAMNFHEIVGCIAGDDTIMAAVRTTEDTTALMDKIHALIA